MDVFSLWWLLPDSNWGHKALQASALPTELKSHIIIITVNVRVWLLPYNSLRSSPLNHLGKEKWFYLSLASFASPNWGHKALQASALPTELKSLVGIDYKVTDNNFIKNHCHPLTVVPPLNSSNSFAWFNKLEKHKQR